MSTRPRSVPDRPRLLEGSVYPAEVLRLAEAGAIADVHGREVRVTGGVPGDQGTVRVLHVGKHAIWGRMEQVETPSPHRVEAPCPVSLQCGGCPWQMVDLPTQRAAREADLRQRLGDLVADARFRWWPAGLDEVTTGYRTRALMMAFGGKSGLRMGFWAAGSHRAVAAEGCVVQHPLVNDTLERTRRTLERFGVRAWDERTGDGQLRAVLYRVDPAVGTGLLTLVVTQDEGLARVAQALLDIPSVCGVFANINTAQGGHVLGPETRHMGGAWRQQLSYGPLLLEVGPTSFVQTRHDLAPTLVAEVAALLPQHMDHLVDLYAGVGVFGLALRQRADRVTLVERDPEGLADAGWNIRNLQAHHVTAVQTDAAAYAATLAQARPDAVLLDPPRSGCAPEVLAALDHLPDGAVIVYVSCGAAALARDLKVLAAQGWKSTDVSALEMFPHTAHAEVVVRLARGL